MVFFIVGAADLGAASEPGLELLGRSVNTHLEQVHGRCEVDLVVKQRLLHRLSNGFQARKVHDRNEGMLWEETINEHTHKRIKVDNCICKKLFMAEWQKQLMLSETST